MTANRSIREKALIRTMVFTLFILVGIYSCTIQAQSLDTDRPMSAGKDTEVHIAFNANLAAKAVALNPGINSPYVELKPALAPDGSRLYFSRSFHPNNTFGSADQEDIWYSELDKTSDTWSDPIRMQGILNNAGPNFINSVSVTGDTIILGNQYRKKGKMQAGLSYSTRLKGQWSTPISIKIKNDYNISNQANAFVSLKNGVIIQAIERVETLGERDLYVSLWNGMEATEPINMGGVINTELEESSPYLDPDNKTLYFASKGHSGYGGYDIFVTRRLDDSWTNWSVPENLGPAVNGAMDDEHFVITHCGNYGIFSKQVSVHNVDLFKVSIGELFGTAAKYKLSEKINSALVGL